MYPDVLVLYCTCIARYYWSPADPEIVSDMLFAIANVLTYAQSSNRSYSSTVMLIASQASQLNAYTVHACRSVAKTTYIMPGFEIFGPLQIAFTRMLSDVVRFAVLFFLVRSDPTSSSEEHCL